MTTKMDTFRKWWNKPKVSIQFYILFDNIAEYAVHVGRLQVFFHIARIQNEIISLHPFEANSSYVYAKKKWHIRTNMYGNNNCTMYDRLTNRLCVPRSLPPSPSVFSVSVWPMNHLMVIPHGMSLFLLLLFERK